MTPAIITTEMAAALALAETILRDGVEGVEGVDTPLSKVPRSVAEDAVIWLGAAPPDLPRKDAHRAAGVGPTKGGELEAAGVLEAFNDGSRVKITTRSIARRRIALAILSHPHDGPRRKIREPRECFKKQPRARTPAELEGLRKGNAARRAAKLRREAKRREARV